MLFIFGNARIDIGYNIVEIVSNRGWWEKENSTSNYLN